MDRIRYLQTWLNFHGVSPQLAVDGQWGPATRSAVIEVFRNTRARSITPGEVTNIALRYGIPERAMMAVASVESAGSGWDNSGLMACLFERHYAWRRIKVAIPFLSDPTPGGYTVDADKDGINDSWEKLADLTGRVGFNIAFECASFGKFQIMGAHWKALGYDSVAEFVWLLSQSEAEHYEAFAKFLEVNGLLPAIRKVDGNPANCLAIARGYNGKAQKGYDERIAAAWRRLA